MGLVFYDPIKNQSYLNLNAPTILYFLERGAQPTATVRDILKKSEVFKELFLESLIKIKRNSIKEIKK